MATAAGRPALPPRPAADEMVSFRQLYRYVEGWDWLILALAVLGSLGSGARLRVADSCRAWRRQGSVHPHPFDVARRHRARGAGGRVDGAPLL